MPSFSRTFAPALAIALTALLVLHATAFECPTIDNDTMMEVAKTCIADDEGLCGESCFSAVREAALSYDSDDFKIPCGDGLDEVIEVMKGCMQEQGLTLDYCDGKNERIRARSSGPDQLRGRRHARGQAVTREPQGTTWSIL